MKQYDVGNRDILEQDRQGGHYFRHVLAMTAESLNSKSDIAAELAHRDIRIAALEALINSPHTANFLEAVKLEAAHQRERWAADHDTGKTDADWFWLVGHLAGKAIHKPEKQLHHIITTAAALLNWHMARTVGNDMRPGIAP